LTFFQYLATFLPKYGTSMNKTIHPKYFAKAKITCACGASYEIGSTMEQISVELCANCHPFYTGTQKIVDTARRVEKFETRKGKKAETATGKKAKAAKRAAKKTNKKTEVSAEELKKKVVKNEK